MIANIAAYRFVAIDDADDLGKRLRDLCHGLGLKGTILLAPEGINLFLAGPGDAISEFLADLVRDTRFAAIEPKWSWSDFVPFKRLRVKLKQEIVTLRFDGIAPASAPAPIITAVELKRWYAEGRDFVTLDTRNEWEFAEGTFRDAVNPQLHSFSEFPSAIETLASLKDRTVVTFCTGGIRCEKAAPLFRLQGFREVYQLQGGILNYLEACGGAHWQGNCVVFDDRGALDPQLRSINKAGEHLRIEADQQL
ncbi:MAG: hypothetical protein D4S02_18435 [Rhodocyclaceae bacterium]|nr:MAG: hypothetical protein D4S02_18435 [Rhodocyclaceae bacterium]